MNFLTGLKFEHEDWSIHTDFGFILYTVASGFEALRMAFWYMDSLSKWSSIFSMMIPGKKSCWIYIITHGFFIRSKKRIQILLSKHSLVVRTCQILYLHYCFFTHYNSKIQSYNKKLQKPCEPVAKWGKVLINGPHLRYLLLLITIHGPCVFTWHLQRKWQYVFIAALVIS